MARKPRPPRPPPPIKGLGDLRGRNVWLNAAVAGDVEIAFPRNERWYRIVSASMNYNVSLLAGQRPYLQVRDGAANVLMTAIAPALNQVLTHYLAFAVNFNRSPIDTSAGTVDQYQNVCIPPDWLVAPGQRLFVGSFNGNGTDTLDALVVTTEPL